MLTNVRKLQNVGYLREDGVASRSHALGDGHGGNVHHLNVDGKRIIDHNLSILITPSRRVNNAQHPTTVARPYVWLYNGTRNKCAIVCCR